jgi:hypothetical protein
MEFAHPRAPRAASSAVITIVALGLLASCAPRGQSAESPATANDESAAAAKQSGDATSGAGDSPAADSKESASSPSAGAREIPSACVAEGTDCSMPDDYVEQLCHGKYPELAIVFFSKAMPWRHVYLKAEWLEPVNVYGGERSDQWMKFGEEVVVLRKREAKGSAGVQVSGPTDLDILRWDGTCATVRQEMLANYVTGPNKSARVVWKYLDQSFRDALEADVQVKRASEAERKVCRGGSVTHPSEECEKAMLKLTDAIALAVKNGLTLPQPPNSPAWTPKR